LKKPKRDVTTYEEIQHKKRLSDTHFNFQTKKSL
jgi:hypothetical protein